MTSDTTLTPESTTDEKRRTYHYKMLPSKVSKLVVRARRKGMWACFALEAAIDLWIAAEEEIERKQRRAS